MKLMARNLPFSDNSKKGISEMNHQSISIANDKIYDQEGIASDQMKIRKSIPSTNDLTDHHITTVIAENFDFPAGENKAISLQDGESVTNRQSLKGKTLPPLVSIQVADEELRWISLYRQRPAIMTDTPLSKSQEYLRKEEIWLKDVEKQSGISFASPSSKCFSTSTLMQTREVHKLQPFSNFDYAPVVINDATNQNYDEEDDSSSELSEVDVTSLQLAASNHLDNLCDSPFIDLFSLFDP